MANPLQLAANSVAKTLPGGLSVGGGSKAIIDVTPRAAKTVRTVAPAAVQNIENVVAKDPRKLSQFGKIVLGTTAVGGVAGGVAIDNIIDSLHEMPPVDRMEAINELGQQFPEIAEDLRSVNNALAKEQRASGAASYTENRFGDNNIIADRSVTGVSSILDPNINEVQQMLDTTYRQVRSRMPLQTIKALQWLINNCSEDNLNVLEDRYQYGR